jgi:hypothetical protein
MRVAPSGIMATAFSTETVFMTEKTAFTDLQTSDA